METKLHEKLHSGKGFTLAETLLAMLIMLMVTAMVAAGIPTAKNAYENVVLTSNAELLLSTTVSALRNELGPAKNVKVIKDSDDHDVVQYFDESTGITSAILLKDGEGICLQTPAETSMSVGAAEEDIHRLVSQAASTEDLYVTYDTVTSVNGIVTFTGLRVMKPQTGDAKQMTDPRTIAIRVLLDITPA